MSDKERLADKDTLLSLLAMHMNQMIDHRTRQWEGVKYYTSILTLMLSLILGSSGFVIANRKNFEETLMFFKLIYLIASVFLIYVSYFASLNLHRETRHLFTEIYVVHKIREKLGLYSEDIYPKEIINDLDEFKAKGIYFRSGLLLGIKDKVKDKEIKIEMDRHSIPAIFKATLLFFIKRNAYSTFLGIMTGIFFLFFILGVASFFIFLLYFPPLLLEISQ